MRKSTIAFSLAAVACLATGAMVSYATAMPESAPQKAPSRVAPATPYLQASFTLDNGGQVMLQVNAPTKDEYGSTITGNMTIKITRDCLALGEVGTSIKTWTGVTPGEPLTCVDDKNVVLGNTYVYHTQAIWNGSSSTLGSFEFKTGFRPERMSELDIYTNRGDIPVTITAVCPTTLSGGDPFPEGVSLSYVSVRRAEYGVMGEPVEIGRITDVAPGKVVMYEDNDPELKAGTTYTYSVAAGCPYGESYTIYNNITLGLGEPANVTNLTATLREDGSALVKWDAPMVGVNNTWIDPEELVYDIYRFYNEYEIELIAEDYETDDCTFVDYFEDMDKSARFAYQVVPVNDRGPATPTAKDISNYIIAGPINNLPFHESFNSRLGQNVTPEHAWESRVDKGGPLYYQVKDYQMYKYGDTYDPKYGTIFGYFHEGEQYAEGEVKDGFCVLDFGTYFTTYGESSFISDKINIANAKKLNLRLKYYDVPYNYAYFKIYLEDVNGNVLDEQYFDIGKFGQRDHKWEELSMDINTEAVKKAGSIKIRLFARAKSGDTPIYPVAIDEICLYDTAPVKLTELVTDEETGVPTIRWENAGDNMYDQPTHTVSVDGVVLGSTKESFMQFPNAQKNVFYSVKVTSKYLAGESNPVEMRMSVDGTSVDSVAASGLQLREFYNMQGLRVDNPENGETVIVREVFADGSVNTYKTVVRR